jgi:hypothetical protein
MREKRRKRQGNMPRSCGIPVKVFVKGIPGFFRHVKAPGEFTYFIG